MENEISRRKDKHCVPVRRFRSLWDKKPHRPTRIYYLRHFKDFVMSSIHYAGWIRGRRQAMVDEDAADREHEEMLALEKKFAKEIKTREWERKKEEEAS